MTLENVLRGSGDIGAMAATVWGLYQIDEALNQIYIQNVKPRDFDPCEPFVIEGRPHLDKTGCFAMPSPPGFAGKFCDLKERKTNSSGRPPMADSEEKKARAIQMQADGKSQREIADKLDVGVSTVNRWLKSS